MKKTTYICISLMGFSLISHTICAQKNMPLIKATSKKVDIKDDELLKKEAWSIVPEAKPDVYLTSAKKVTFYTDLENISFKIDPKVGTYNFMVLLNGKDSAWTQIQYQQPFLEKLKGAKKYNPADARYVPKFTYQAADNIYLAKIRRDLKLDSIAGTGNEVSRILNLLHWVHNTIRHDGSSDNPAVKNALNIVQVCKTENRGVNCRMMATVLNECYLAMGIKSRHITCMPKETKFDDCHVINMVYSNDLQRWIWIDPTFDAYVMDEKGELLGVREVRERLINDKPLILNPDANWNKKNSQTKKDYLDNYMAKNLYRLQTPMVSEYDLETGKTGKEIIYVELLPLDGLLQEPQKVEQTETATGVKFITYKTNNPDLFWVKPE
jgi:hypothetical protein